MPEVTDRLRGVLATARARLGAAGIPEPAREAARLWADSAGEPHGRAFLDRDRSLDLDVAARFMTLVERRAAGEPLPYVTGWVGFRRLDLRIDRRALIPRPETEGLVDLVLERVRKGRVVDVGTGSGCIALSLASEGGYDLVLGIDHSAAALTLAATNRQLTGARVDLVQGDLTSMLGEGSVDLVVSNPPYLTDREHAGLDAAVSQWEPREALVSGPDGLDATVRLLEGGHRVLRPGGWLALELDATRAAAVAALARGLRWQTELRVDLFGRERYLLARRSERP